MTCSSSLDTVQVLVYLVCAVDRDIDVRVLVNVSEAEVGIDDELLGLEPGGYKDAILVDLGPLSDDALDDVWYRRA